MKAFLKILLWGFLGFMVLAMTQEWRFFASAWFGAEALPIELAEEDREAAESCVSLTLSLMRHLYSSGGDPRFAERIPAAAGIVEEMLVDVDYVTRNHRRQEPELIRLDVESTTPLGENQVEIHTREFWRIHFRWIDGSGESDPPRNQVIRGRYLVVRDGKGWHVEGWELRFDENPSEVSTGS
jgi:hypothetical protein